MNEKQHFPHFPATHASGGQRGGACEHILKGPGSAMGVPEGSQEKQHFSRLSKIGRAGLGRTCLKGKSWEPWVQGCQPETVEHMQILKGWRETSLLTVQDQGQGCPAEGLLLGAVPWVCGSWHLLGGLGYTTAEPRLLPLSL